MIDNYTLSHLANWIDSHIVDDDRETAINSILAYINEYPDVTDRWDWWTVYNVARREGF